MKKPNVLLINCDDLGYGDLSCYGSRRNRTPVIDKLASEGIRFTSAYCSSSVCSPSRAALMTGCYPPRIGINRVLFPMDHLGLNPEEYTMPQMFHDADYDTMLIGKWHCGDQTGFLPCDFGFDDFYGLPYSNDMGMQRGDPLRSHSLNFVQRPPLPLMSGNEVIQQQPDQRGLTERYTEKAISYIRGHKDRPFFLYLAHFHVHLPLYANERFARMTLNGDFGACVEETDWSCDCIFRELKAQGIYDDTIIIFTSDNGARGDRGSSNFPLKGGKFSTWEGGQRIPFILRWGNGTKGGRVSDAIVSQIDLLPTFASIIGAKLPEDRVIDGTDISSVFTDENARPRDSFVYYGPTLPDSTPDSFFCAIRKNNWKLHLSRDGKPVCELYDLNNDFRENNNLADRNPDIVEKLKTEAEIWIERLGDATSGVQGKENRKAGFVENPVPLTEYDPNHPYIIALYDKDDKG